MSVTNRSTAAQYVTLYYDVPQFTMDGGYPAGTSLSYGIGYVAAGATQSVTLDFTVLSGTQAPPNGSLITLVVTDRANGALVSHTVAVNFTLAMLERLNWPRGRLVSANPLFIRLSRLSITLVPLFPERLSLSRAWMIV